MDSYTSMVLSNGLLVINFSSPHTFRFSTGEVLDRCSDARAQAMAVNKGDIRTPLSGVLLGINDVGINASLCEETRREMYRLHHEFHGTRTRIIVPRTVLDAWKSEHPHLAPGDHSFRTIFSVDRISKEIYVDNFCY